MVTTLRFVDYQLLPSPVLVFESLGDIITRGVLFENVFATLRRVMFGFLTALFFGLVLGGIIGSKEWLFIILRPFLDFFRSLPGTACFPLFLLIFGIGDGSKIAISAFISIWVIILSSVDGVRFSSRYRRALFELYGTSRFFLFLHVSLPEALPHIMTGVRQGVSLALIAEVVGEMFIGTSVGLGQKIYDAYLTYESAYLYSWLLITGLLGILINWFLHQIERRLLFWAGK